MIGVVGLTEVPSLNSLQDLAQKPNYCWMGKAT